MSAPRTTVALAAVALAFAAACGLGSDPAQPPASSSGTASATPTAEATASPTPEAIVFTADGTGPYLVGTTLASLNSAGLLDSVTTGGETCSLNTRARGTGDYHGVWLSFRPDGLLYLVTNRSADIPTTGGIHIGDSEAELVAAHPDNDALEPSYILVNAPSGRAMLFDLGFDDEIISMSAADGDYLESSVVNGTDFC